MVMELPPPAIYYVDEPADISIRNGVVCCIVRSGDAKFEFRASVPTLVSSVGNGARAYANHVGARAKIIPLRAVGRKTSG